MREKTAVTKGSPTYSALKQNLSTVGNSHKRLTFSAFTRLLPRETLLVLHEVWLWLLALPHQKNPHSLWVQILTGWLTSALPEKGFLTFTVVTGLHSSMSCWWCKHASVCWAFSCVPSTLEILPSMDYGVQVITWPLTIVFRGHLPGETLLGNCPWTSYISNVPHCSLAPCTGSPLTLPKSTDPRVKLPPVGVAEKRKALSPQAMLSCLTGILDTYRLISDFCTEGLPILCCVAPPHWEAWWWTSPELARSSSDPPCKRRPSLPHRICSSSQMRPGPFTSKEFLSILLLLHLIKVYTEPEVSLMWHISLHGCWPDGVPYSSAMCKDVFQGWTMHVTGVRLLGERTCLGSSHLWHSYRTPCSEHAGSSSAPHQPHGDKCWWSTCFNGWQVPSHNKHGLMQPGIGPWHCGQNTHTRIRMRKGCGPQRPQNGGDVIGQRTEYQQKRRRIERVGD